MGAGGLLSGKVLCFVADYEVKKYLASLPVVLVPTSSGPVISGPIDFL